MEMIIKLTTNLIIMFGLVFFVGLSKGIVAKKPFIIRFFIGVVFGLSTIIIMANSWQLSSGAIFDARSIMIAVLALFFSYETSITATVIAIIYRLYLGGDGVYAGVLTLVFALAIGLIWKSYFFKKGNGNKILNLYIFGVVVHIAMLASQLAFPYPMNIEVLQKVGPYVIIFYPIAVTVLSVAVLTYQKRAESQLLLKRSEESYRTLIQNSKLGIIHFNTEGVIELANDEFANILGTERKNLIGLNMNSLPDKNVANALHNALQGKTFTFTDDYVSYLSQKKFPARVKFSPIIIDDEIVGGIGIIEDLTYQIELQKNIQEITKTDALTKLHNRSAFDEFLYSSNLKLNYPVSIIVCGINKFTIINTSFGYDIGNLVLVEIASILRDFTKNNPNCRVFRVGGDQFAMVLESTSKENAELISDTIKQEINSIQKFDFDINVSCGIETALSSEDSMVNTFTTAYENNTKAKIYEGSNLSLKTVDLIMSTLFSKSVREENHSRRVSTIARKIADLFNLGTAFSNRTELAGKLHDIGKIIVSIDILDKPGKLSKNEWEQIKKHPQTGFTILSSVPEYLDLAYIVYSHHERWDGNGYPRGLKNNKIPLEARIISVADSFDAMTYNRPYHSEMSVEEAIIEIKNNSGTQFDPDVVEKITYLFDNNIL